MDRRLIHFVLLASTLHHYRAEQEDAKFSLPRSQLKSQLGKRSCWCFVWLGGWQGTYADALGVAMQAKPSLADGRVDLVGLDDTYGPEVWLAARHIPQVSAISLHDYSDESFRDMLVPYTVRKPTGFCTGIFLVLLMQRPFANTGLRRRAGHLTSVRCFHRFGRVLARWRVDRCHSFWANLVRHCTPLLRHACGCDNTASTAQHSAAQHATVQAATEKLGEQRLMLITWLLL